MPATADVKRQNFNVTPEQEAELLALQREFDAPSVKDAIFKAVRLARYIAREVRNGRSLALKDGKGNLTDVALPDIQTVEPSWTYLIERPDSWKKQLFVKGRRLTAFNVWADMQTNKMTLEETAANWDLPKEAVAECIEYCNTNMALIKMECDEEKLDMLSHGLKLTP